jgi:multidrug resistance efflux pump
MKRFWLSLGRFAVTLAVVTVAAIVTWQFWVYYMVEPWTRDGRVRADVVGVAPDVSGLVTEVVVHDNQEVRKGDLLFRIDTARFELALRQAEAVVVNRRATWEEAVREMKRYLALSDAAVSAEKQQQSTASATSAGAAYDQAVADRDLAKLNLERSNVTAPVNGSITDFSLRPGDYVSVGKAVAALVDSDSFYVAGYFEETKLPRIQIGDKVLVRIVGESQALDGHVEQQSAAQCESDLQLGAARPACAGARRHRHTSAQSPPRRRADGDRHRPTRHCGGRTACATVGRAQGYERAQVEPSNTANVLQRKSPKRVTLVKRTSV